MSLPKKHIGLDFARLGRSLTLSGGRGLGLLLALLVLLAVSRSAVPIVADEIAPSKGGSAAAAAKRSIMDLEAQRMGQAHVALAELQIWRANLQQHLEGDNFALVLNDLEWMGIIARRVNANGQEALLDEEFMDDVNIDLAQRFLHGNLDPRDRGQMGPTLYLEQELAELSHDQLDALLYKLRNRPTEGLLPRRVEFILDVITICDRIRRRQFQARLGAMVRERLQQVPRLGPAGREDAIMLSAIACCLAATVIGGITTWGAFGGNAEQLM